MFVQSSVPWPDGTETDNVKRSLVPPPSLFYRTLPPAHRVFRHHLQELLVVHSPVSVFVRHLLRFDACEGDTVSCVRTGLLLTVMSLLSLLFAKNDIDI